MKKQNIDLCEEVRGNMFRFSQSVKGNRHDITGLWGIEGTTVAMGNRANAAGI